MNVGSVSKPQAFSKKATISQMIAYDIMEISPLICVNQMSVLWTVDCICTTRGQCQFLSLRASDQRGFL